MTTKEENIESVRRRLHNAVEQAKGKRGERNKLLDLLAKEREPYVDATDLRIVVGGKLVAGVDHPRPFLPIQHQGDV